MWNSFWTFPTKKEARKTLALPFTDEMIVWIIHWMLAQTVRSSECAPVENRLKHMLSGSRRTSIVPLNNHEQPLFQQKSHVLVDVLYEI
jgi:hypothetical protein